jgi:hypothetical protein
MAIDPVSGNASISSFLDHVLAVNDRAGHTGAIAMQFWPQLAEKPVKSLAIYRPRSSRQSCASDGTEWRLPMRQGWVHAHARK